MDSRFGLAFSLCAAEGFGAVGPQAAAPSRWGLDARRHPGVDLVRLTEADARQIHRRDYWDALYCQHMAWPMALYLYAAALRLGKPVAIRLLQDALGVGVVGVIDTVTLSTAGYATRVQGMRFLASCARHVHTDPAAVAPQHRDAEVAALFMLVLQGGSAVLPPGNRWTT